MNRAALAYAETVFPAHRVQPVRTVESHRVDGRTVIASYHSLSAAAAAAAKLPTRAEWDEIEVIELVGPPAEMRSAVDPQGPAGLAPRRVGAAAAGGAVLGAVVVMAITLLTGGDGGTIAIAALVGAVLGAVVGFAAGGVARFGGERAEEQAPQPIQRSVAVLSVWTPDEQVASVIAHALSTEDPIEIRVVDSGGHWHAPIGD